MDSNQNHGCCNCGHMVDEHHVMCDACFMKLREQAFSRLLQHPVSDLPLSMSKLRERLSSDCAKVEQDPEIEKLRTKAGKFFLSVDYPNHYRFKE